MPCYHLADLHEAIKHELPPTPNGIVDVWRVIMGVRHNILTLCCPHAPPMRTPCWLMLTLCIADVWRAIMRVRDNIAYGQHMVSIGSA